MLLALKFGVFFFKYETVLILPEMSSNKYTAALISTLHLYHFIPFLFSSYLLADLYVQS